MNIKANPKPWHLELAWKYVKEWYSVREQYSRNMNMKKYVLMKVEQFGLKDHVLKGIEEFVESKRDEWWNGAQEPRIIDLNKIGDE